MLVKILIVKRLLFKNVTIMPNDKMPKMFRTECNVPADTVVVIDLLSYSACSKGIAYVKLKRNLEYHGHVLFQPFRTVFLDGLLKFLIENNPFYGNIVVKTENVSPHVSSSNVFDGSCQQKSDDGIAMVI